ncbi:MAG: T9SS type A sorting domain-containing protein [Bacteroidetes bacterium]|nr:T9SS type A sorting domain-containing protein [Bacteroidota bacterium]
MKKLLIVFVLFIPFLGYSQTWAPIGAKWQYNKPASTSLSCVTFESIQDTIIQSNICHILEIKLNNSTLIGKEYIKQSGDSIFYFNYYSNSFHLLYNLSANVGDTINVHTSKFKPTEAFFSFNDSIDNFKYQILSIDSVQISGKWIKRQKVCTLLPNDWGFNCGLSDNYILDNIGSNDYFFGMFPMVIPEFIPSLLRCYTDTVIAYINPSWSIPCDFVGISVNLDKLERISIFPNPSNGNNININLLIKATADYEILNVLGSVVAKGEILNADKIKIDISNIAKGCYFVKVISCEVGNSKPQNLVGRFVKD